MLLITSLQSSDVFFLVKTKRCTLLLLFCKSKVTKFCFLLHVQKGVLWISLLGSTHGMVCLNYNY